MHISSSEFVFVYVVEDEDVEKRKPFWIYSIFISLIALFFVDQGWYDLIYELVVGYDSF